jgi:flavin-dependent dehydrogenase
MMLGDVLNFDVIVIGCGPAGSATAIASAQRGLRVVMIERELFPRSHPGETLHPGVEPLLQQLGVIEPVLKAGFLRHTGNWVKWEAEKHFVPFGADDSGAWLGFQAWRADFDTILLNQAKSLGVTVIQPCQAFRLLVEKSIVVGVETSHGSFRASQVVDAAGSYHWLARQLELLIHYHSPRLIAYYGYATGECPLRDDAPAIIADSEGWTWTARVRPLLYQWTRLSLVSQKMQKDWLPEEFHKLKSHRRMQAADVTWRIVSQPAGLGYFMVGDAAMVLDPASSHGVLKAMMSGIMAGHLIAEEFFGNLTHTQAAGHYCQWIRHWFQQDVENLNKLYALLPN